MDPTVLAAWIAAGVSVVTLVGTLTAQYLGRRATARDSGQAFAEQRLQLERTLGEQRIRTFNERFASAAVQLGSDKRSEVRLAGVHANREVRHTIIRVITTHLAEEAAVSWQG